MTSKTTFSMAPAANDNGPEKADGLRITCDLPTQLGIIDGEADLLARHFAELLQAMANDNDEG